MARMSLVANQTEPVNVTQDRTKGEPWRENQVELAPLDAHKNARMFCLVPGDGALEVQVLWIGSVGAFQSPGNECGIRGWWY